MERSTASKMLRSLHARRVNAQLTVNGKSTALHVLELLGSGGLAGVADVDHFGLCALIEVVPTEKSLLSPILDEHEVP